MTAKQNEYKNKRKKRIINGMDRWRWIAFHMRSGHRRNGGHQGRPNVCAFVVPDCATHGTSLRISSRYVSFSLNHSKKEGRLSVNNWRLQYWYSSALTTRKIPPSLSSARRKKKAVVGQQQTQSIASTQVRIFIRQTIESRTSCHQ